MKYSRLQNMEEYVLKKDFVSLDELCSVFERSKNTIRRDVSELVKSGAIEKVYGGVRAAKPPSNTLLSFSERTIKRSSEKQHIGALAARFVRENDVIFIDSGTTALNIIPYISHLHDVTILTNNLHAIHCCMEYPQLNTIAFGGQLNTKTASFSSNFCSLGNLQSFNINKAFMAATGVSIEKGATNSSPGELAIKKSIMEKSDTRFLVVDSTKFNHSALLTYAELSAFQYIVTDRTPPELYGTYLRDSNIELVTE